MKLFLFINIIFGYLFESAFAESQNSVCEKKDMQVQSKLDLAEYIIKNPVKMTEKKSADLNGIESELSSDDNEYINLTYNKPFNVKYLLFPNSKIKIIENENDNCGPQIFLISGKIEVSGDHFGLDRCDRPEVLTEEAEITAIGTEYTVESTRSAIANELNELNGTPNSRPEDLVTINESYKVQKGEIRVKLRKISAFGKQNLKVKYNAKNSLKIKNKKIKQIAANKIKPYKIKAGGYIKFSKKPDVVSKQSKKKLAQSKFSKQSKTLKKQVAELEIYDPDLN